MTARVLRFVSTAQREDAERVRNALQHVARVLAGVTRYTRARKQEGIAEGAEHLHAETLKLLEKVDS